MASMLPASTYGLKVPAGGLLVPATLIPGTIRITMAAIDPSAQPIDGESKTPRATLRIVREPMRQVLDEDDSDYDDMDDDSIEAIKARLAGIISEDEDDSEDDDSEEEKNGGPSDPVKAQKAKAAAFQKKLKEELESEEMEIDGLTNGVNGTKGKGKGRALDEDDDDEDDDDDISSDDDDEEVEDFVICTLDSEKHYQQTLDITIGEDEDVGFIVTGDYDVYLTGNYVLPPDTDDYRDDEEDSEDEDEGLLGYDLSPDEDELDEELSDSEEDALDGLNDPRVTEVGSDDEDEAPKLVATAKKGKNKRPADSSEDEDGTEAVSLDDLITQAMKKDTPATNGQQNGEQKLSKKQAKKLKKNDGQAAPAAPEPTKKETPSSDKKKVQFAKNLELGPTGSPKVEENKEAPAAKTGPRNVNGVSVEDKKVGKGKTAKKGDRIEMRYIGKLKNGKQFDANKKGKPFSFKLGVGEVIKGWDIGVVGMAPGGERRLTIPAKLAYGSKALPDIPANSDLVFDIKCMAVH